jgi:hypothetical protein
MIETRDLLESHPYTSQLLEDVDYRLCRRLIRRDVPMTSTIASVDALRVATSD